MRTLEEKAKELRLKTLNLAVKEGETHLGGSFSEIEILISLYDVIMKKEDKFILSKGHSSHPMYLLLEEKGYNPDIRTHPDIDEKNGIYCTTGSLGHGLPIAAGMALARKFKKQKGNIYVLMGDGECQEGTTWETIPLAVKYKLNNLNLIVDNNKLQALEKTDNVSVMNLKKIFDSFGCYTLKVNGHSFPELIRSLKEKSYDKPKVIIADTFKGKGVKFMENNPMWHARVPNNEELNEIYKELK